jgi:hypothetical protein
MRRADRLDTVSSEWGVSVIESGEQTVIGSTGSKGGCSVPSGHFKSLRERRKTKVSKSDWQKLAALAGTFAAIAGLIKLVASLLGNL